MGTMLSGICTLFVLFMMVAGVVWLFENIPFLGVIAFILLGATTIAAASNFGSRRE